MLCYLTIACLTLSLFFVTDREFASGLYNKIAQLIEGKLRVCWYRCLTILCTCEGHNALIDFIVFLLGL